MSQSASRTFAAPSNRVASRPLAGTLRRAGLLAAGLVAMVVPVRAQIPAPTHAYELNGTLADTLGGPSLSANGTGTLGATGYTVAAHGSGLTLEGAIHPLEYSIEMVIRIDPYPDPEACNWEPFVCSLKALDTQDRATDEGFYMITSDDDPATGRLQIFPLADGTEGELRFGELQHLVVTRDASGLVSAYLDGTLRVTAQDDTGAWAFDVVDTIHFLMDDLAFEDDPPRGHLDRIVLYDEPLSPEAVAWLAAAAGFGGGSCVPAPAGVIGWWPGDGDSTDIVGGRHGVLVGDAGFAPGVVGDGFHLDGNGDSVNVANTGDGLDPGAQLTIDLWVRGDEDNPMDGCCQGLVTTDFYELAIAPGMGERTGVVLTIVDEPTTSFEHSSDSDIGGHPLTPGVWHHVAGVYDGDVIRMFVDGEPVAAHDKLADGAIRAMLDGTDLGDSFLAIGSEEGRLNEPGLILERYFKGLLDEVTLYDRALSPVEIQAIHAAGEAGKCKVCHPDEAAPVIECGAPETIAPPGTPLVFLATAVDACGAATVAITGYDCFKLTKKGRPVDKTEACAVAIDGSSFTVSEAGGVGTMITWTVEATDSAGNTAVQECAVRVTGPNG